MIAVAMANNQKLGAEDELCCKLLSPRRTALFPGRLNAFIEKLFCNFSHRPKPRSGRNQSEPQYDCCWALIGYFVRGVCGCLYYVRNYKTISQ